MKGNDCEAAKMKSLNSPKSPRLLDFVPSIRPSFLSVMLLFVCGCLWVKNERTNERLIALESRIHCFPCGKRDSVENLDSLTLSPTTDSANGLYKKMQTHISEGIGYNAGKVVTVQPI